MNEIISSLTRALNLLQEANKTMNLDSAKQTTQKAIPILQQAIDQLSREKKELDEWIKTYEKNNII